jgi:hypothetical protein
MDAGFGRQANARVMGSSKRSTLTGLHINCLRALVQRASESLKHVE